MAVTDEQKLEQFEKGVEAGDALWQGFIEKAEESGATPMQIVISAMTFLRVLRSYLQELEFDEYSINDAFTRATLMVVSCTTIETTWAEEAE